MQIQLKHLLLSPVLLISLAACSPKPTEVDQQVTLSVADNEAAKSVSDWHSSPNHPERLFSDWNRKFIAKELTSAQVCAALQRMSTVDLTLYEEQIRFAGNQALLKDCSSALVDGLDNYWAKEREKLNIDDLKEKMKTSPKSSDSLDEVEDLGDDRKSDQGYESNSDGSGRSVRNRNRDKFEDITVVRDTSKGYYAVSADLAPKQVLLTFDDGPHGQYTDMILKALDRVNAKALFFHKGQNSKAMPQIVRRVARDGHSVGSHSNTHACLPMKKRCESNNGRMLTHEQAKAEIRMGHQAVQDALGWVDPFFRFPYGESSPELKKYLAENGVGEFFWSVDSNDWRNKSPEQVVIDVMTDLRKQTSRGANLLFHDVQRRTAEAMPALLELLLAEGYDVVLLQPKDLEVRYNSQLVGR